MVVKIALVRPEFRGLTHPPDMPIGMLSIAAYLDQYGYPCDVFDLNNQEQPDWTQYDVIGFSMLPLARKQVYELIDEIKKWPETKIVLGGVFPSSIPEFLIKNLNIDAIVVGEGEQTMLEYIHYLDHAITYGLKEIPGLCTKEYGLHKPRKQIGNLDDLPFPIWDKSNFDWFKMTYATNNPDFEANGIILSKEKVAMLSTSRGCTNIPNCTFCDSSRFWQNKYRFRSAKNVFKEVRYLNGCREIKTFSFNDDAFPVNKKQCIEFCKLVEESGMKIAWKSDTRADVLDEEMIIAMKKSGCFMVAIGVESASEKIRKNIGKNLDINKAKETIRLLKKHGILAYVLLMVGNVGETRETIIETKKFLIETQPDIATWVTGVMMCPGTELYNMAKKNGLIHDDYWIWKTNGMPNYHGELSQEQLSEFAGLLNGWKK